MFNRKPQRTASNAVCVFFMMHALFTVVLLIGDLFHPLHVLTTHFFLNGDMRHVIGGRRAMPVFHAWRYPDDISWLDFVLFTTLLLHPAEGQPSRSGPDRADVYARPSGRPAQT